jgi:hypothetical protein
MYIDEGTNKLFKNQKSKRQTYKSNLQYKSLRFGFANPKLKDSYSPISIFKDSFRAIVLRIRKDLLDL